MANQEEHEYEPIAIPAGNNIRPTGFEFTITGGNVYDFFETKSQEYLQEAYRNILAIARRRPNETADDLKFRRSQFNFNKRKVKRFWSYITRNYRMREINEPNFWNLMIHAFVSEWYREFMEDYFGLPRRTKFGKRNPILVALDYQCYAEETKVEQLREQNFLEDLWEAQGIPYLNSIKLEV